MFFIFGWNHQTNTPYGPVEQCQCQKCNNTELWQLNKKSNYFTLFFLPIFSHTTTYWYQCPICNHGLQLDKKKFDAYKSIAQTNAAFLEMKISQKERDIQLQEAHKRIEQIDEAQRALTLEESKDFTAKMGVKTDLELLNILNEGRNNYNPAFIIAVEEELNRRKLNN